MLTAEQQEWIDHLSDAKTVAVIPYDPTCEEKFLKAKAIVQKILGPEQEVVHSGASSLGISGQDEIDVYVPVPEARFDATVAALKPTLGAPASLYPLKRARLPIDVDGKHVDVFVINETDKGWTESVSFMKLLRSNAEALERYRKIKEEAAGQTVREYYRRKTEFINEILSMS